MEIKTFFSEKPIIAMIHLQALPGTPRNHLNLPRIIEQALAEARLYHDLGITALAIENMHDVPYLNRNAGAEIIASMTAVACKLREEYDFNLGIQILAGANKAALAVALAAGLDFIRAEGFVFGHLADEGYMDSDAGELLRYRRQIGAEQIAVFTDIKKKHSAHSLTADISIGGTASAAEFFLSDGLIVTGSATGKEAQISDLVETRENSDLPVLIGSGLTAENIGSYLPFADAFIVGSYFKQNGHWMNPPDRQRVENFMRSYREALA
ncbi:MAG TPA: BtpA/SgcQ family protein [Candidatus Cloacimonadota bacterium]|nr:BtpA/SgcQ family protein [Candidatus Cloacimonadota bacterium]HPS38598.1 BtpA/SgcQ family protein [Candidatus Cloacimonadota bacterium]